MVIGSAGLHDTTREVRTMAKADLKHYEDAAGRVFSLDESDARMLGYTPVKLADKRVPGPTREDPVRGSQLAEREKALNAREAELVAREKALETKATASTRTGPSDGETRKS